MTKQTHRLHAPITALLMLFLGLLLPGWAQSQTVRITSHFAFQDSPLTFVLLVFGPWPRRPKFFEIGFVW